MDFTFHRWTSVLIFVACTLTASAVSSRADVCTSCLQHPPQSCPKPLDLAHCVFPSVMLGSPAGALAGQGPYVFQFKDANGAPTPAGVSVWLVDENRTGPPFFIGSPYCSGECIVDYPFVEGVTDANGDVTFSAAFSGSGFLSTQFEWDCPPDPSGCTGPGYYALGGQIEVRSTDMVGSPLTSGPDGDTDQDDKINFGRLLKAGTASTSYDYNNDGVVDGADYLILTNEYLRESSAVPTCAVSPGGPFVQDTSPPGAVTDLHNAGVSGNLITLAWTAPGDDTDPTSGQIGVAKTYDLRCSFSTITNANWSTATQVGGPTPSLAGATDQIQVDRCSLNARYWALKTKDSKGNWSTLSNVLFTGTPCHAGMVPSRDPRTEPVVDGRRFDISGIVVDPGNGAAISLVIPAGPQGGQPVQVDVLDVAGRHVRTVFSGELGAGEHILHWGLDSNTNRHIPGGVYLVRARQGSNLVTRKVAIAP